MTLRSNLSPPLLPIVLAGLAALATSACDDGAEALAPAGAQYLVATGTWLLDDSEQSFSDPRNPRRLELTTTEQPDSPSLFSFYADAAGREPLAKGCSYQYNRSQPDSHRFPESKQSVWVIFDLAPGNAPACEAFARVGFAPTLGGDARIHLRYGTMDYAELVGPAFSDPASPTLWWSLYRPVKGTRPAPSFPYAVANGEHLMDATSSATTSDPRNPSRVTLSTPSAPESESRFVFYKHDARDEIWADCNYQVRYTMPDPSIFPGDKMALWDAFEMTRANAGQCAAFARVVMFFPDGGEALYLRYGDVGFESLLSESLVSADTARWARYCPPDATTGCAAP